jgi:amidase
MMTDQAYATLTETADAVRLRKISPVELAAAILERIEALDPQLHAYAALTPDLAMAQARKAEADIAAGEYLGPLHGIPIAIKDICDTAGIVTASGMPLRARHVPDEDSTVVRRLAEAGAVLLGKLQLTEGAFAKHHPMIQPPVNPWNADYYSGASSSGSGVATAAGLCFGAIGSDTGGSIRYPAAANGVTGLKPTCGRVSRHGVFPLAPSLDHIGTLTRSAADAGALLSAIAGFDAKDPTSLAAPVPDYLATAARGVRGLTIGIDPDYNEAGLDAGVVQALRAARRTFEELGAIVREVQLPDSTAVAAAWATLAGVEASLVHAATYPAEASEYGPAAGGTIAGLIEHGRTVSPAELMRAHYARLAFTGALAALFTKVELLLIPTQPRADFTIAEEAELFSDPVALANFIRFATPFDMSGSPALVLPAEHASSKGLPLSFQLIGRHLDEALLVRAGSAYQRATDGPRIHPSLTAKSTVLPASEAVRARP